MDGSFSDASRYVVVACGLSNMSEVDADNPTRAGSADNQSARTLAKPRAGPCRNPSDQRAADSPIVLRRSRSLTFRCLISSKRSPTDRHGQRYCRIYQIREIRGERKKCFHGQVVDWKEQEPIVFKRNVDTP